MQKIPIEAAGPGMVVASTVRDKDGNIVFMRGVTLAERHIVILNNRGIREIVVEGTPSPEGRAVNEALVREIDLRFSTAGSHPAVEQIRALVKELLS